MQTSMQGIANKAREDKKHRFRNLFGMLNEEFLMNSWKLLNKKSAVGVDKTTAEDYAENLSENIKNLVERVKRGSYRAKLVKRQWIPKGNGKLRPLGIPVTEDKLLQVAVTQILSSIYEEDFLDCSYGYRENRSPQQAALDLRNEIQYGSYRFVVEADIKGFFDHINHEWMIKMVEHRIDDKSFIRLIKKWLKAGILEKDGKILHPVTGTPQGGIVSPVLANIYLHYALDLWFEKVIRKGSRGAAYLCRYADDFVCLFEYKDDADRFYKALSERLAKFNLTLSLEKTRILAFSRFPEAKGNGFDFLGFEYRWGISRKGKPIVKMRTSSKKFRRSLTNFAEWCRKNRSIPIRKLMKKLNAKLRGYYNYYGVIGNYESLQRFYRQATRILKKWLSRRSQRKSYNWERFRNMLKQHRVELPRITQKRKYSSQLEFVFS
jgi:group II intron reverse transcriptase/maturase